MFEHLDFANLTTNQLRALQYHSTKAFLPLLPYQTKCGIGINSQYGISLATRHGMFFTDNGVNWGEGLKEANTYTLAMRFSVRDPFAATGIVEITAFDIVNLDKMGELAKRVVKEHAESLLKD